MMMRLGMVVWLERMKRPWCVFLLWNGERTTAELGRERGDILDAGTVVCGS
jgi:hypothetical protein